MQLVETSRKTEIGELHVTLTVQEYVVWFDVTKAGEHVNGVREVPAFAGDPTDV